MTSRLRSVANFSVHEKATIGDTKISISVILSNVFLKGNT
jgi:hypothetical protein